MGEVMVELDDVTLPGMLEVPPDVRSVVVFAHGSGSSRHSPRNQQVADGLRSAGHATLLLDLLTDPEAGDRRRVFDIELLAARTAGAVAWAAATGDVGSLPIGLFGASTGAAAALDAAAADDRVRAVVSRGGRPDLARRLTDVHVPVLLIVGGADVQVLELNHGAAAELTDAHVEVVPGAGHLFEGPGELETVTGLARDFFDRSLPVAGG